MYVKNVKTYLNNVRKTTPLSWSLQNTSKDVQDTYNENHQIPARGPCRPARSEGSPGPAAGSFGIYSADFNLRGVVFLAFFVHVLLKLHSFTWIVIDFN